MQRARARPPREIAGVDLATLPTPALLLEQGRFVANCERMRAHARALGVGLRPHMKTLKAYEAARVAIDPAHGGIAVSTLREAEYFAGHGIEDIQLAVCIAPDKLPRAATVARHVHRFGFFVDSVAIAAAASAFAAEQGVDFRVWIEIDSGDHRTGVPAESEELVAIAEALGPHCLAGVATHAGRSYAARHPAAIATIAESERSAVTAAADRLRAAGFDVAGLSAGSTPTATHLRAGDGLTELRPGVYMAGDLFQAAIGSMDRADIAVSVLASVISHDAAQARFVIDAGALALSKDRSTAAIDGGDAGYGLLVARDGTPIAGDPIVASVHQEHGEVRLADAAQLADFPIGSRVRVLPNHACMTTAMYDRYVLTDGDRIVGEWEKCGGW